MHGWSFWKIWNNAKRLTKKNLLDWVQSVTCPLPWGCVFCFIVYEGSNGLKKSNVTKYGIGLGTFRIIIKRLPKNLG